MNNGYRASHEDRNALALRLLQDIEILTVRYDTIGYGVDREDLRQELFLEVLRLWEKYDPQKGSFTAFAKAALPYLLVETLRRKTYYKRKTSPGHVRAWKHEQLRKYVDHPEQDICYAQQVRIVRLHVQRLPKRSRMLYHELYIKEKLQKELVKVFRIKQAALCVRKRNLERKLIKLCKEQV